MRAGMTCHCSDVPRSPTLKPLTPEDMQDEPHVSLDVFIGIPQNAYHLRLPGQFRQLRVREHEEGLA